MPRCDLGGFVAVPRVAAPKAAARSATPNQDKGTSTRKAVGPVVAAPGDQPHPVAIAFQPQPVAVVFHLVEPIRAGRDAGRFGCNAEVKSLKHGPKIGICGSFWSLLKG